MTHGGQLHPLSPGHWLGVLRKALPGASFPFTSSEERNPPAFRGTFQKPSELAEVASELENAVFLPVGFHGHRHLLPCYNRYLLSLLLRKVVHAKRREPGECGPLFSDPKPGREGPMASVSN